ncbi:MAG: alpha/beta hydrolase [Planctomycetota bacterium]
MPAPAASPAASPPGLGVVDAVDSAALGERRVLNVWLPPGYDGSEARYPVICLLDGSAHEDYHHVSGLVQFCTMYERMPPSIVVGIANVDRYRDFTHPSALAEDRERLPTGGGSAAFLAFVEHELLPHVEARYRTDGRRTLIGQSMGGLLATEVLVDHPELFQDYVIVSPSLWWADRALLERAPAAFAAHDLQGRRVFVCLGKEHPEMHDCADELVQTLRQHAPAVAVGYETLADETHATVLHMAVYRALRFLYGASHPGL